MNFPSQIFFNDIGYKEVLMKENSLWQFNLYGCGFLLLLWKGEQNECPLLKYFYYFSAAEVNNIESEDEVFAQEFSCEESDFWDCDDEYI